MIGIVKDDFDKLIPRVNIITATILSGNLSQSVVLFIFKLSNIVCTLKRLVLL